MTSFDEANSRIWQPCGVVRDGLFGRFCEGVAAWAIDGDKGIMIRGGRFTVYLPLLSFYVILFSVVVISDEKSGHDGNLYGYFGVFMVVLVKMISMVLIMAMLGLDKLGK